MGGRRLPGREACLVVPRAEPVRGIPFLATHFKSSDAMACSLRTIPDFAQFLTTY
jgi:hypothetical protein